mgnify:CR=1 FL=1
MTLEEKAIRLRQLVIKTMGDRGFAEDEYELTIVTGETQVRGRFALPFIIGKSRKYNCVIYLYEELNDDWPGIELYPYTGAIIPFDEDIFWLDGILNFTDTLKAELRFDACLYQSADEGVNQ